MSGLHAHPELGRGPKYGFKADSHFSGHAALPFEQVIQRPPGYAEGLGERDLGYAAGRDLIGDQIGRVRRFQVGVAGRLHGIPQ
jgi:hypothetical protein